MARKKVRKPQPVKPAEPRQLSPEMQARMDHFVKAMGHLILMKMNPETARRMNAEC